MKTLREEIEKKYSGTAKKAKSQPRAAIRLFCIECMGGDYGEAKTCKAKECYLWPFSIAARFEKANKNKK